MMIASKSHVTPELGVYSYSLKWSSCFYYHHIASDVIDDVPCYIKDSSGFLKTDSSQASLTSKTRRGSTSSTSSSGSKASSSSVNTASVASGTKLRRQKSGGGDLNVNLSGIGGRDSTLFLFRALGKILYFKRRNLLIKEML